jgi:hypothetical protein
MLRLARVRRHVRVPIETRSLPALARSYPRHFTFYVADPISSIPDLWQLEAVRALQQGKDPPSPRLLLKLSRAGGGTSVVVQAPTAWPTRVHALHPTLTDMVNHVS